MGWLDWLAGKPTVIDLEPATVGLETLPHAGTVAEVEYHIARFTAAIEQDSGDVKQHHQHLAYWTNMQRLMAERPA